MLWLVRMAALFTLAAAAGLGTAKVRNFPLFPDEAKLSCEEDAKKNFAIDVAAFKAHYASGYLVIDARPAEEFEKGHLACPLIMNVPSDQWNEHLGRLMNFSMQPIAIYCTSLECHFAEELFCNLRPMGFGDMKLFRPGWLDGILKENLPTATGPEPGFSETPLDEASHDASGAPDSQPGANRGQEAGETRPTADGVTPAENASPSEEPGHG